MVSSPELCLEKLFKESDPVMMPGTTDHVQSVCRDGGYVPNA